MDAKEHIMEEASQGISADTAILIFSLCITGALILLMLFFVITLSDLECDYLNAPECCSRLNFWTIPKLVAHVSLSVVFLFAKYYWLSAASIPLAVYYFLEYRKVQAGDFGVYEPTEILKHGNVKQYMLKSVMVMAYYLVAFFIYLYCLLNHLLKTTIVTKESYL